MALGAGDEDTILGHHGGNVRRAETCAWHPDLIERFGEQKAEISEIKGMLIEHNRRGERIEEAMRGRDEKLDRLVEKLFDKSQSNATNIALLQQQARESGRWSGRIWGALSGIGTAIVLRLLKF